MKTIDALERIWAAEVEGRLPFQSKAAIYKRLTEQGLLESVAVNMSGATVRGFQLTHAGRLQYCMQCSRKQDK